MRSDFMEIVVLKPYLHGGSGHIISSISLFISLYFKFSFTHEGQFFKGQFAGIKFFFFSELRLSKFASPPLRPIKWRCKIYHSWKSLPKENLKTRFNNFVYGAIISLN